MPLPPCPPDLRDLDPAPCHWHLQAAATSVTLAGLVVGDSIPRIRNWWMPKSLFGFGRDMALLFGIPAIFSVAYHMAQPLMGRNRVGEHLAHTFNEVLLLPIYTVCLGALVVMTTGLLPLDRLIRRAPFLGTAVSTIPSVVATYAMNYLVMDRAPKGDIRSGAWCS